MSEFCEIPSIKKIIKSGGSLGVNLTREVRTLGLKEGDFVKVSLSSYEVPSGNPYHIQSMQINVNGILKPEPDVLAGLKKEGVVMVYVMDGTIYFHGIFEEEIDMEEGLEVLGQERVIHIAMRDGAPVPTIEPLKTGITIEYSMFDIKHGARVITQGLLIKSSPYEVWTPVFKAKEE